MKTIYDNPLSNGAFAAERTLEQMTRDKEALVLNWGEDAYNERKRLLEEYLQAKNGDKWKMVRLWAKGEIMTCLSPAHRSKLKALLDERDTMLNLLNEFAAIKMGTMHEDKIEPLKIQIENYLETLK